MSKHIQTDLIHAAGHETAKKIAKSVSTPKVLPIYMTSVYNFDDVDSLEAVYGGEANGYVYSRDSNPGLLAACEMVATAEGAEAAEVFSSGMAAITSTIIANIKAGDHILSSPVLYGGVYSYFKNELPKFGVEVTFVDFSNPEDIKAAMKPNTKIVYTETIINPLMDVCNIPEVAKIAHEGGAKLIIDNTFATPSVVRPMEYGADIVVYSVTKYMGGHSDLIGGAAAGSAADIQAIHKVLAMYGALMGPMEAWLLTRSLRTLDMRMRKHSENALKVAEFFEKHPKIEKVHYAGLASSPYNALAKELFTDGMCGGMMAIDLAGGEAAACKLMEVCPNIKFVPSLASYSTTMSYPARTSHRAYNEEELKAAGITMGTLRISIGLEEAEDIIAEFAEGLEKL